MKLARAFLLSSLAMTAAVGCAAVAGFEPLTFEPDGGAADGTADAQGPGDSSIEGAADAKPLDAGRDSRAPIGCKADPGHDFCDDFSDVLLFDAGGWSGNPAAGGATITRDQESLLSVLASADSGAIANNMLDLVRPWTKQANGLRPPLAVRARLFVEECPTWATVVRFLRCTAAEPYCGLVQLVSDRGQCWSKLIWVENRDGGLFGYHHLLQPTPVGEWHDLTVLVEENANGSTTLTYELDGERTGAVVEAKNGPDEHYVAVGIEGPEMGGRFRIDDVRVDWTAK